jgi:hypothetical protein
MRRSVRGLLTVLLPLLSIAIVLAIFELGLRITGHQAIYEIYSKPSLFWRHDKLLGWSHEPGAQGDFVGPRPWPIEFRGKVSINSLGLRGPEIPTRDPSETRVLFSGDSIVASLEVDHEQTFVALLEGMLREQLARPVRAINAGVRGYGTDQDYLYFRERGWQLDPDLVVLFHSGNDPSDNTTLHEMRRPFGKAAFSLSSEGELSLVGVPVPHYPSCSEVLLTRDYEPQRVDSRFGRTLCDLQMVLFDHSALFSYFTLAMPWAAELLRWMYYLGNPHADHLIGTSTTHPAENFAGRLTTALILAYADEVARRGASFLLVAHAGLGPVDSAAIARAGIQTVDLTEIAQDVGLRWHHDGHYNPAGHRRVADALVEPIAARLAAPNSR